MQDDKRKLPEGTDRIIAGASAPTVDNSGTVGVNAGAGTDRGDDGEVMVVDVGDDTGGTGRTGRGRGGSAATGAIVDKIRSGREKLSSQAADKTRGLVNQGLERSAEALANVGKLVGDTADGLDERLGAEYGDYARRAATAIEDTANSLATKDADELIDDTREFVRKSPGVALAGAAIIGFALARLVKTGLAKDEDDGGKRGGKHGGKRES
ncbi:MAG TPA: hypothetical protein VMN38_02490 [Sphingomicrobium sp.]|nr:hypothetical protein [Sphingomicrobium sp.]